MDTAVTEIESKTEDKSEFIDFIDSKEKAVKVLFVEKVRELYGLMNAREAEPGSTKNDRERMAIFYH